MSEFRPITEDEPTEETLSIFGDSEAPFPLAALPPGIRFYIEAVTAQNETPVELAAASSLATVSGSAGAGIRLVSGKNKTVRPNLFFLTGAKSGLGKTTTFLEVAARLLDENQNAFDAWEKQKRDADGAPPPCPAIILENASSESVARALHANPGNAAAVMTAEARAALDIMLGKYQKGAGMDTDVYCKGFSGEPLTYGRTTSNCFAVRAPCLTAFLVVQPGKLCDFCSREEFVDSGLASRFLMMLCDIELADEPSEKGVPPEISDQWHRIIDEALAIRSADAVTVDLAPEAMELRREIKKRERMLLKANKNPALESVISRLAEQSQRLALVLHIARNGRRALEFPVAAEDMAGGVAIARWYLPRAVELLAPVSSAALERDRQKLLRVFGSANSAEVTLRILRGNHGILEATAERLAAAYPTEFRIHTRKQQTGRPSRIVALIR